MFSNETRLELLREHRAAIVAEAKRAGRTVLSDADDTKFRGISAEIDELESDIERSAANSAAAARIQRGFSVRMIPVPAAWRPPRRHIHRHDRRPGHRHDGHQQSPGRRVKVDGC